MRFDLNNDLSINLSINLIESFLLCIYMTIDWKKKYIKYKKKYLDSTGATSVYLLEERNFFRNRKYN